MRKISLYITSSFTAAGIAIALLRWYHLNNCIDSSGLPESSLLTSVLNILPAAALIVCLFVASILTAKKSLCIEHSTFHTAKYSVSFLIIDIIAAFIILFSGISSYPAGNELFNHHSTLSMALVFISTVVIILNGFLSFRNFYHKATGFLSIFPTLYSCLKLIEVFTENLTNPVTSSYYFECIAFGAFSLFYISQAGCILKRDQTFSSIISGLMGLLFIPAAFIGSSGSLISTTIYISLLLLMLPRFYLLVANLAKHESN